MCSNGRENRQYGGSALQELCKCGRARGGPAWDSSRAGKAQSPLLAEQTKLSARRVQVRHRLCPDPSKVP